MKLLTYKHGGRISFGAVSGDGVVDGPALLDGRADSIRAALDKGLLEELQQLSTGAPIDVSLQDIEYLPPILDPTKILCVGVNYADHRTESGYADTPLHPTIFSRFPDTHVGHRHVVVHPPNTTQLDYEGEVAIVIGRHVNRIDSEADTRTAIAGLSCYNDLSARDWQLHNSQWLPGKNFRGVGSFGPWLVTTDEFADFSALRLTTRVDGEVRQDAKLADLIFDFTDILRYITGFTDLAPGDVVVTGTPGGVGFAANPPLFLVPGSVTEVEVSGVGVLRNKIIAARGPAA
ncbi:fumarylacetoacetate hydrolase family protein (plasmid) [Mycolicibacterium psychrotolerans]|uniref:fumarylacetoacetate hydrolase family protein n=1 Tax=Mycolicibacterium psychrotolerans TaxID=216929 RepID=UPI003D66A84F